MAKKKKAPKDMKIDMTDMMLNSANKQNKSMPSVYGGTGAHKSKRDYTRKEKHKERLC